MRVEIETKEIEVEAIKENRKGDIVIVMGQKSTGVQVLKKTCRKSSLELRSTLREKK